jgi:hypothetical protein
MRVKDLIERLSGLDQDRPVLIQLDGDLLEIRSVDDTLEDYVEIEINPIEANENEYNVGE